mmetsp:Transcript_5697/g.16043  ORF Transcript_5697/g.16043 Transcript_5697/m.16043 type:complete len:729 (+) Transcript_5697:288-2474(+)|eukprot:CAMPEP_0168759374 /NCGR_PEP_ID=MMETSP0724-20121128/22190_1 /TAXON_ID=265536 /ORGANISM="Amphiprora sp., Strain CCMP467" /LENGTH=728 /DNA_ID=CAMNT_0008808295 /DNA_START=203 /DNA_END=2389 /DNA_ORIENTATION=+
MAIIYNIPPNVFNVLTDLMALTVAGIFYGLLAVVYPHMIWDSVQQGKPVSVNALLRPPTTLGEALARGIASLRQGPPRPSRWLVWGIPLAGMVVALSHAAADLVLDFVTVETGSEDRLFLGSRASGALPSYSLLGDTTVECRTVPGVLDESWLLSLERIARGASRFSILPPEQLVDLTDETQPLLSGLVSLQQSNLTSTNMGIAPARPRPMPPNLEVTCNFTTDAYTDDEWHSFLHTAPEQGLALPTDPHINAIQFHTVPYTPTGAVVRREWVAIPKCDYETAVPHKSTETTVEADQEWTVLNYLHLLSNWDGTQLTPYPFGVSDDHGDLRWYVEFSENETELSFLRDTGWHHGRSIRDHLVLAVGIESTGNETHWWFTEPWLPMEHGIELKVEYSVLSGPGERNSFSDVIEYTISSWSRDCPTIDSSGTLQTLNFDPLEEANRGCIIDLSLSCYGLLTPDRKNSSTHDSGAPTCIPVALASTLIQGVTVDRSMLAAYAGIATRVRALNAPEFIALVAYAMNSIAAAYIGTREIVPGTVAVEGVRASVGPEFVVLLVLPLLVIAPFLFFLYKNDAGPIPRSVWHAMILGRNQEIVTTQSYSVEKMESFIQEPKFYVEPKYGFLKDDNGEPHLGLGVADAFVPRNGGSFGIKPITQGNEDGVERGESPSYSLQTTTDNIVPSAVVALGEEQVETIKKKKHTPHHKRKHSKHRKTKKYNGQNLTDPHMRV